MEASKITKRRVSISGMLKHLGVSRSGYRAFTRHKPSAAQQRKDTIKQKIRKIYDYLCRNVHYDKVHRKNPYYHRRSTAYGALVQGTATCQGYCTAMYRLLREEGIPCRIVTGTAGDEELHAWLIAELDGSWYLLDPTWDAGQENYRYCLRGTDDFRTGDGSGTDDPETGIPEADPSEENSRKTEQSESGETGGTGLVLHVPGPVFQTEDFLRNHPMAAQGR